MIACDQCGFQNVDSDAFCGSCGSFLEWTGKRDDPPPVADDESATPKRSLLSRVQTVLSLDVHAPGEQLSEPVDPPSNGPGGPPRSGGPPRPSSSGPPRPSGPPSSSGPPRPSTSGGPPSSSGPPRPSTSGPPRPSTSGPPSSSGPPSTGSSGETAAALVANEPPQPPAEPRTVAKATIPTTRGETTIGAAVSPNGPVAPSDIGPVKPTVPIPPKKPAHQPPTRKIVPGDLVCGACGEGNPPARNFCSRCGTTLRDAEVAKRSWWKRLIPHRRRRSLEAGARPWKAGDGSTKRRRGGGKLAAVYVKLRPIVAAALLVAGLVVGFQPDLRSKFTGKVSDARDSLMRRIQPRYAPLQPVAVALQVVERVDGALADDGRVLDPRGDVGRAERELRVGSERVAEPLAADFVAVADDARERDLAGDAVFEGPHARGLRPRLGVLA